MKTFSERAHGMCREPVMQAEPLAVPDFEPVLRWDVPSLVRCACSDCGTHAYRRLAPDGASALSPTGAPATCRVCGGSALEPLDLVVSGG
jgi:hypothetical protein